MRRKARIDMSGALHHLIIRGFVPEFGGEWKEVSGFMASGGRVKGEERILGDGDFVMDVLKVFREEIERRYRLKLWGLF